MEVKGMGERREGDGGSLRNPRKKGGRGSERMMVRGNRCRTGIKHKRGTEVWKWRGNWRQEAGMSLDVRADVVGRHPRVGRQR